MRNTKTSRSFAGTGAWPAKSIFEVVLKKFTEMRKVEESDEATFYLVSAPDCRFILILYRVEGQPALVHEIGLMAFLSGFDATQETVDFITRNAKLVMAQLSKDKEDQVDIFAFWELHGKFDPRALSDFLDAWRRDFRMAAFALSNSDQVAARLSASVMSAATVSPSVLEAPVSASFSETDGRQRPATSVSLAPRASKRICETCRGKAYVGFFNKRICDECYGVGLVTNGHA